jgi:hypothetical protein
MCNTNTKGLSVLDLIEISYSRFRSGLFFLPDSDLVSAGSRISSGCSLPHPRGYLRHFSTCVSPWQRHWQSSTQQGATYSFLPAAATPLQGSRAVATGLALKLDSTGLSCWPG